MADIREQILSRLEAVLAVEGIMAVARNTLDVPFMMRPGAVLQDGAESRATGPRGANFSEVQQMELIPQVRLYLRGSSSESGPLMSLFRGRILYAVFSDDVLRDLVGSTGAIRYEGCALIDPTPETKEPRMEINLAFLYTLKISEFYEAPVGISS